MTKSIFIRGSGRAGQAAQIALNILKNSDLELKIGDVEFLKRDTPLSSVINEPTQSVLVLSNPPGLHVQDLLEAEKLGLGLVICEKPICVDQLQIKELRQLKTKVAVLHVYRQTWGLQTIKKLIDSGDVGQLISIEGRYWQSSAAKRAIEVSKGPDSWKNDSALSGNSDTLLDIGCHWSDAAIFLGGLQPSVAEVWLSHQNSEAPHRDTHVQLTLDFKNKFRAMGSISKTFHGGSNHFEVNVIGTKKSLTWNFLNPDQILVGRGGHIETLVRTENNYGSKFPAFHALGWLEGYIEIFRQSLRHMQGQEFTKYPTLAEGLSNIEMLLQAKEKFEHQNVQR